MAWRAGPTPRRAAVSAFGFGGTNAHVVLEEAPPPIKSTPPLRPVELLVVSARTVPALAEASANLAHFLEVSPEGDPPVLADIAHTLQVGRRGFVQRRYV